MLGVPEITVTRGQAYSSMTEINVNGMRRVIGVWLDTMRCLEGLSVVYQNPFFIPSSLMPSSSKTHACSISGEGDRIPKIWTLGHKQTFSMCFVGSLPVSASWSSAGDPTGLELDCEGGAVPLARQGKVKEGSWPQQLWERPFCSGLLPSRYS